VPAPTLETPRLLLRQWRASDREPFAALNADPVVMEHFVAPIGQAESDAFVDRQIANLAGRGYGLWAVEVRDGAPFIGFVGLESPAYEAPFTPAVEVGWRLARAAWGNGFATEAARAALDFGFDRLRLGEIVSFTAPANVRSIAVMERLGMTRDPADDFDHPRVPPGHPLRRHVLYRLDRRRHRGLDRRNAARANRPGP
jgi:ribosomal-protein-alanine N-acetyltransferase